jgi:hypothetical protein
MFDGVALAVTWPQWHDHHHYCQPPKLHPDSHGFTPGGLVDEFEFCLGRGHGGISSRRGGGSGASPRKILKINSLDAISWHLTTRSSIYKNSRRRKIGVTARPCAPLDPRMVTRPCNASKCHFTEIGSMTSSNLNCVKVVRAPALIIYPQTASPCSQEWYFGEAVRNK